METSISEALRFWSKVNKNGPISHLGTVCWLWTGAKSSTGYGCFALRRGGSKPRSISAHKWAYGEVQDGLRLDHLCTNKLCVNPGHLEAVTHSENIKRAYRRDDYGYIMNGLVSCHG